MCDHEILIEKCEDHRKKHQKFLRMFDNVIQTVLCMQSLMTELNTGYNEMLDLLKVQPKPKPSPSPHKRRKAQSFDSPSSVTVVQKEETPRNRSNPEVSGSALDQNIDNLPDTEDSFFALTQSPSRREPLSPVKAPEENVPKTPPKRDPVRVELFGGQEEGKPAGGDKKKRKSMLSLSRFSSSFETSPETSKQAALLPLRQKLTTPKPKSSEQENVVPPPVAGKWTAKKTTPGSVGRMDSTFRKTPTGSSKKGGSLLNRTRMRQTKLKFQDCMNKSFADDDDETYFDEFVVPSPTSATAFSGSRFLKSAKKKEQSTLIAPPKSKTKDTPGDEDFDIDQTYFSEAEKDLTRLKTAAPSASRIKVEPLTQKKSPPKCAEPSPVLAKDTQDPDSTSSVIFVKPPSQDEIITIEETQPKKEDLFMKAIREERRKEDNSRLSVLNVMGPPPKREVKKEEIFAAKSDFNVLRKPTMKVPLVPAIAEPRRCFDCTRQFKFLLNCGQPADVARNKLPMHCRECRLAQLHDTPPGFWNPEFTPTQM
nr:transcriptional regulator ATRX homolog [Aedes albopictus]